MLEWIDPTPLFSRLPVAIPSQVVLPAFVILGVYGISAIKRRFWDNKTTPLSGPPNPSFFFGHYKTVNQAVDRSELYEGWVKEHGPAYWISTGFGSKRIVICDPKANGHFYSKETYGYVQTKLSRVFIENLFGRGLLWAEGDSHRRQRKALSPAFSNAAIRKLTPVFYDAAYQLKALWDAKLDAGENKIDVQICLDSIGIAGFGHNFHAIEGHESPVVEVFESFGSTDTSIISQLVFFLGPVFPMLQKLPTKRNRMFKRLRTTIRGISDELLERNRREKAGLSTGETDKSIIGLLVKAETSNSSLGMSEEEILAQMNVLLLAGYETTSISLTWALIELSRKPEKQQRLRDELAEYSGTDPTFDQLSTGLPFLDAIAQEVLRLHPPVSETTRILQAAEDDVIPFSKPFTTADGKLVSELIVPKGTVVSSPISYMNMSEEFWGPDSREFRPERWLADESTPGSVLSQRAKEIGGHKHILTFVDGPRLCLGKSFALAEFKAVLSVLIRNYSFELPDGPDTKIEKHPSILPRPKLAGEKGARVPLIIKKID
ncbi:cytochrome P450 [Panaeolus papilionaceus]|nr:cytochrome P450 [Panaeolus papilionaceus]